MAKKQSQYEKLGVQSDKSSVREAFAGSVENEYTDAFVNIVTDAWDPSWVMTKHGDGNGSKSVTHWLYYLITGDEKYLQYDSADACAMAADIVAGGFTGTQVLTDTLDINGNNVDKELIMANVRKGIDCYRQLISKWGILSRDERISRMNFLGGETADLPDQVGSYIINVDVFSRMERLDVIIGNVEPGDSIFGFSSGGRAFWEDMENSGHMSNGSTRTRTGLLLPEYGKRFPYLTSKKNPFRGPFKIDQYVSEIGMTIAQAQLCPTRQFAIIMKMVIDELKSAGHFDKLHAIVLNTGGGLTKCKHVGSGIRYVKEIPKPLPFFQLIKKVTKETWCNMFKTYNNGIGAEFIGDNTGGHLEKIIRYVSEFSQVVCYKLGRCYVSTEKGKNEVVIKHPLGICGPY